MNTDFIAAFLLVERLIASLFLLGTLVIQRGLLKAPLNLDPKSYSEDDIAKVMTFRRTLHYIAIALFVGNFLPIVLDTLVVLQAFGIGEHVRTTNVLIAYAVSNATTMLLASYMINKMYKLATQTKEVTDLEIRHLRNKDKPVLGGATEIKKG